VLRSNHLSYGAAIPRLASEAGSERVSAPVLLAVPNISEGRDQELLEAIASAFAPLRQLDLHADPDHGRAVLSLAGRQGEVAAGLVAGVAAAAGRLDITEHAGVHPHVGAVDVAPIVYLDERDRGVACAEALTAAALIGDEVGLPVFLYGELATAPGRRERADLRRGGAAGLAARLATGELEPDFGPPLASERSGALLVTARPPLVAFNMDLASPDLELATAIAAGLRESSGGLPGVRAIGLFLPERGRAQVSVNVHDHRAVPLAAVVERVRESAEIAEAELVGLAPAAALEGFPQDVALRAFSAERHLIENALRSVA
jgi:glutamate formiminotransferase / 5-formyltetrahydrofolate cyclo-ligase